MSIKATKTIAEIAFDEKENRLTLALSATDVEDYYMLRVEWKSRCAVHVANAGLEASELCEAAQSMLKSDMGLGKVRGRKLVCTVAPYSLFHSCEAAGEETLTLVCEDGSGHTMSSAEVKLKTSAVVSTVIVFARESWAAVAAFSLRQGVSAGPMPAARQQAALKSVIEPCRVGFFTADERVKGK